MRKEGQGSQPFLWRAMHRDRPPDTYEIPVMFFGATCSRTSAQYLNNRNALEFKEDFPEAAKAITEHHYVDDYLGCTDTVEVAIKLARDVIEVHSKGGFYICNWTSICRQILESIPDEFRAQEVEELKFAEILPTGSVLGMSLDPEEDQFIWRCNFNKVPEDVILGKKIKERNSWTRHVCVRSTRIPGISDNKDEDHSTGNLEIRDWMGRRDNRFS
jgi:hypothetical protein